ncbi:MAG: hypothetical protein JSS66_07680 [Armatimonadetes bacterium]|nr:hypothetical protein [Armatimonadota bacterium]
MRLPRPTPADVCELLKGVRHWFLYVADDYVQGEMGLKGYATELQTALSHICDYALLQDTDSEADIAAFWEHHRNLAMWNWLPARDDVYAMLDEL